MYQQSEKIVKQQYLLHMLQQYGELRPLAADIGSGVGEPSKFQQVSFLGFVTAAIDVVHRKAAKLCTMFDSLLG